MKQLTQDHPCRICNLLPEQAYGTPLSLSFLHQILSPGLKLRYSQFWRGKCHFSMLCHATAGGSTLSWLLNLAPVPGYSGQAKEKGKLQGQLSISFTHQLRRKPLEAIQVTSYQAPVHPRSCFRSRQLKNSRQGKFPACHSYHSPRHVYGGLNAGEGCPS